MMFSLHVFDVTVNQYIPIPGLHASSARNKLCHLIWIAGVSHPPLLVTTTTTRINTAKPTPGQLLIFTPRMIIFSIHYLRSSSTYS
jgi:hypothetical protein